VKRSHGSNFWRDLMEGYSYAFRFMPIRAILLQLALISFLGMPYAVLMPVYARDILHGGPHTLGFLMAFAGIGALAGAVFLASRKSILGLDRLIAVATCIFGTAMILFSLSKIPLVSYLMLCFVGFGLITQMAASNTILQSIVEEDKRGRIMSLFAVSGIGMMPFGSLYSGMLAGQMGAPLTLIISGTTCIVGALLFASSLPRFRADIRPIYLEKGIISESITRAK
ncbi:MAG TPA: MFS transporter, partial [Bacteroidia bacterium]